MYIRRVRGAAYRAFLNILSKDKTIAFLSKIWYLETIAYLSKIQHLEMIAYLSKVRHFLTQFFGAKK